MASTVGSLTSSASDVIISIAPTSKNFDVKRVNTKISETVNKVIFGIGLIMYATNGLSPNLPALAAEREASLKKLLASKDQALEDRVFKKLTVQALETINTKCVDTLGKMLARIEVATSAVTKDKFLESFVRPCAQVLIEELRKSDDADALKCTNFWI